jgi:hypothetical protein
VILLLLIFKHVTVDGIDTEVRPHEVVPPLNIVTKLLPITFKPETKVIVDKREEV